MMNRDFKHRRKFFMFPLFGLAFVAAAGFVVMYLWNAILPPVFSGVGTLTYLQAAGLLILCRILFGGYGRRGGGGPGHRGAQHWREKMRNMSEEDREKFREQWKERCARK